jgi:hypothetical protein
VRSLASGAGFLLGAGVLLFESPLSAQQPRTCVVVLDEVGGTGRSLEIRPGVFHQFGGGGVTAHCKDEPTRMRSDSVAWYSDRDRMDLVGRVRFSDSTVTLDAARATYFLRDERLEAYGSVSLVNRRTGSRLTGPNLIYYRRAPQLRDTTELYSTNRPTVEYRSESDTAGSEPYVIKSQRVRLKGNSLAWAGGAVTIDRSDFAARSDSASLDLDAGRGELLGHAEVAGRGDAKYQLAGRFIQYRMRERELNWVQARGNAEALSSEWRLLADTVEFDLADRRIQGGRAWTDTIPARAISTTYNIRADSLALDAPGQRLTELRAFRQAFATSKQDSLQKDPDWMAGDTLVARFDTTALGQRILSRLTAKGSARAYYHVPDPERPKGPPGITYSRGRHIAARFTLVGLDRVDVTGAADGVYLEPGAVRSPPPDSTAPPPPTPSGTS